jgi:hypothetical protein
MKLRLSAVCFVLAAVLVVLTVVVQPWSSSASTALGSESILAQLQRGLKVWNCGCSVSDDYSGSFWIAYSFVTDNSDLSVRITSASLQKSGNIHILGAYVLDDGFERNGDINGAMRVDEFPRQWSHLERQRLIGARLLPSQSYTIVLHEYLKRTQSFGEVSQLRMGFHFQETALTKSTHLSFLQCNIVKDWRMGQCLASNPIFKRRSRPSWMSLSIEPMSFAQGRPISH